MEILKKDLLKLNKEGLVDFATNNGVKINDDDTKKMIIDNIYKDDNIVVIENEPSNSVKHVDNESKKGLTKEQLDMRTASILQKAAELNDAYLKAGSANEKKALLYDLSVPMREYFTKSVTNFGTIPGVEITDLDPSDIVKNIPVAIVEQEIIDLTLQYPLMENVTRKQWINGLATVFYKDYGQIDNKSGYDDVTISDYNESGFSQFKEVYQVDTNIHKGYDILDTILNDVTVTVGLFISLVNDIVYAIARPFAKELYSRFITFIDDDNNFDEVIAFKATDDAKEKAKTIYNYVTSLKTPSRDNLKKMPTGAIQPLEYSLEGKKMTMILNKTYASDYNYDLAANTFQLGKIELDFDTIKVLDFTKLAAYSLSTSTGKLAGYQVILIESGIYNEIVHYEASKVVDTPKLKKVLHRYLRIGSYRRKDKIAIAFK